MDLKNKSVKPALIRISKRLSDIIDALPLKEEIRVLEIGCGPGAAAREISKRIGNGKILAIDRSANAIQNAIRNSISYDSSRLEFRQAEIENFQLQPNEKPFDLALAIRVGALDGRHPELEGAALASIAKALTKNGKLYIDGGNPLQEKSLEKYRT
ncbi:MAG: class I SAM-dependent methyltransferase [Cyclobacteriaceae bacterium]|nr:class I SAM-dependent methyltransferase [Cyclobacteriaceae bacterium]